MNLTDEHLAQMRDTVERAKAESHTAAYITPDALEALLDRAELLKRYMAHVINVESIDFLDCSGYEVELTARELEQLRGVSARLER